jgi:hypothetical protein
LKLIFVVVAGGALVHHLAQLTSALAHAVQNQLILHLLEFCVQVLLKNVLQIDLMIYFLFQILNLVRILFHLFVLRQKVIFVGVDLLNGQLELLDFSK